MTSPDPGSEQSTTAGTIADKRMARKAALGGYLGSLVEYYDFFVYGSAAALVFNKIFFPDSSPAAGTLAALATFGVGYIARPVGAVVFGHLGDRIGRKNVLLTTLVMMGFATFTAGCLPTYDTVGAAAPALLVVGRLVQGISAGIEHAPSKNRGFYASWMLNGSASGSILATLVFIPVAALPEDQLLSWG